jgi:hypothetical protein
MRRFLLTMAFALVGSLGCQALADGPVIATGAQRQQIRSTPILERENRPLHFYGNTVRRLNARQTGSISPNLGAMPNRLGR